MAQSQSCPHSLCPLNLSLCAECVLLWLLFSLIIHVIGSHVCPHSACLAGRVRVLPPVAPPPDDGYPFPTPDGKLPEQRRAEGTGNWLHTNTHLETHKNITD